MAAPRGRWVVECPAYTAGPFPSEESAERLRAHVEALGACMFDHEVRESDGNV